MSVRKILEFISRYSFATGFCFDVLKHLYRRLTICRGSLELREETSETGLYNRNTYYLNNHLIFSIAKTKNT